MNWNHDCAAVIPCFNEAAHAGKVVTAVEKHLSKIIVVDDGSTDATSEQAKRAGAEIIRLPNNSGKGSALQKGWRRARTLGFTWVLLLDGDGQHAADDIPNFFECAEKTGSTLVVGNRMENSGAMPLLRRGVNRWMSGCRIRNAASGWRIWKPSSRCLSTPTALRSSPPCSSLFLPPGKRLSLFPSGRFTKIPRAK